MSARADIAPPRQRLRTETVEPRTLDERERRAFFDELFAVYAEVFEGYTREHFQTELESPEPHAVWVHIMRDEHGEIVGFNVVRLYRYDLQGMERDVFRSIAGMKREHRGRSSTLMFGIRRAVAHKLLHPFRSVYYFGALLHPSSYYLMAKHAKVLWPRHDRETSPETLRLMTEIAAAWHYIFDDAISPYVVRSMQKARQQPAEREFWRDFEHPAVRFYLRMNPHYDEGRGLMTLIPLTWSNILFSAARLLRHKMSTRRSSAHQSR